MDALPPHPAARFGGAVALVTGSSRGIGLAIAGRLVREGARVVLTGRTGETLEAAAESLGGPGTALPVAGKGDDPEHHRAAARAALDTWGRLDHVVANVGINPVHGTLDQLDPGAAHKILEVNVLGTMSTVQEAVRAAQEGSPGPGRGLRSVVTIASVAGLRPAAGIGFYGTSKAALLQLTRQLAAELAPAVRVNAVAPSIVRTRFAEALFADREEEVTARFPLGRIGDPEDVAAAVAFLLSDDAAWITGQTLVLDGGASTVSEL